MRSHSGRDEGRNNMHDQKVVDRDRKPDAETAEPTGTARTTEMGSHARKSGQEGHGSHR